MRKSYDQSARTVLIVVITLIAACNPASEQEMDFSANLKGFSPRAVEIICDDDQLLDMLAMQSDICIQSANRHVEECLKVAAPLEALLSMELDSTNIEDLREDEAILQFQSLARLYGYCLQTNVITESFPQ